MSLWQKPENDPTRPSPTPSSSIPSASPAVPVSPGPGRTGTLVHIGQSIEIKGELCGNEDLTIDGQVDGKINLKDHNLTIGENGKINAELRAKTVVVAGEVVGNVTADDRIEIAPSGSVQGDLTAPRVILADGSSFKGSIDMGRKAGASSSSTGSSTARTGDVAMAAAGGLKS